MKVKEGGERIKYSWINWSKSLASSNLMYRGHYREPRCAIWNNVFRELRKMCILI